MNAVLLLSGGVDSATVAAMAKSRGFAIHALTFAYGQRHAVELKAARRIAEAVPVVEHLVQVIDLRSFGGSALTDRIEVPKSRSSAEMQAEIPATYVPARNTIFLAFGLAFAEARGARDVFIGANAVDFSGYPDCRPEFIDAFQRLANVATKAAVSGAPTRIHAPLIAMTKAQIIREGLKLGVDYSLTHSCYDPIEETVACGQCDSCLLRLQGFREAGVQDVIRYARR